MFNKTYIVTLLETRDAAVAKALIALNERQTATEQSAQSTINHNGVGFTPADAFMGTSMAKFFASRGYLTPKQLAYWRKPNAKGVQRICKYAGQLLEIANTKARAATAQTLKQPTTFVKGSDVGNLLEEQMALEETLDGYREGAMGEGPAQDAAMERIFDRMIQIKEEMEEINRCEFKMKRDGMAA
jgi:hypothetical protein